MGLTSVLPGPLTTKTIISSSEAPKVLAKFINEHFGKILLLTGAGCSRDSGIPTDVGLTSILSKLQDYKPIRYSSYNALESQRQRFWHRSIFSYLLNYLPARPSTAHKIIAELTFKDAFHSHFTSNVDGLFYKAKIPKEKVVEVYGNVLDPVKCYKCSHKMDGFEHLSHLKSINPFFDAHIAQLRATSQPLDDKSNVKPTLLLPLNPNGDVVSTNRMPIKFTNLVPCPKCGERSLNPGAKLEGSPINQTLRKQVYSICGVTEEEIAGDKAHLIEQKKYGRVDPNVNSNFDLDLNLDEIRSNPAPKAILALGVSLDSRRLQFLLNRSSLSSLPFIYLNLNPATEWPYLGTQPSTIIDAPINPTLEKTIRLLEKYRLEQKSSDVTENSS